MTRPPTVVVYDQLDYLDWVYTIEEEALSAVGRAAARAATPGGPRRPRRGRCRHRPRRSVQHRRDGTAERCGRHRLLLGGDGPGRCGRRRRGRSPGPEPADLGHPGRRRACHHAAPRGGATPARAGPGGADPPVGSSAPHRGARHRALLAPDGRRRGRGPHRSRLHHACARPRLPDDRLRPDDATGRAGPRVRLLRRAARTVGRDRHLRAA